jgi:predicted component of type VI protein secretion system
MPRLFILSGPDLGKIHSFEGEVRLGRTSDCDIVVHGPSISRIHARLSPEGGAWVLTDLDSSNGIHLGSIRAKRFELSSGDVFRLGKIELRFRVESAKPTQPADQAAAAAPEPAGGPSMEPHPAPAEPDRIEFVDEAIGGEESGGTGSADDEPAEGESPSGRLVDGGPADDEPKHDGLTQGEPEDDELFLEEEIDLGTPSPEGAAPRSPSASLHSPATAAPSLSPGTGGASPGPRQSNEDRSVLRAAAQRRTAEVTDRREREILQFSTHRSESSSSAMTSDLSQHPVWVRVLAVSLVLVVSAALFWIAFRGASSLRGDTSIVLEEEG